MENLPESTQVVVAYALPDRQFEVPLNIGNETTVGEAVARSKLVERLGLDPAALNFAIFGRPVTAMHPVRPGDRIELLRPLGRDVKETRRRLARQGKSMGRQTRG